MNHQLTWRNSRRQSRNKAVALLIKELAACKTLEIPYLVLHPGARLSASLDEGLTYCAQTINEALAADNGTTKILIENMAGQGSTIGSTLEELQGIYHHVHHKKRVGFCFDTCHGFAAGYSFTAQPDYHAFWGTFDRLLGMENLHAIHLNDRSSPQKSHVDRHAT